jgi:hypothetical protein
VIVHGRIPGFGYAKGMASYLRAQGIRLFDFPTFAQPLRDEIRSNAEELAAAHGIEVQFIRRHEQRKDLGLCFMRVSTWCPFGVQAYFNGHNVLAAKLRKAGIEHRMLDNAPLQQHR